MEEDHYVAEDFLHILWHQQLLLKGGSECPFCNQARILSLGTYPKYFNHREASSMVRLEEQNVEPSFRPSYLFLFRLIYCHGHQANTTWGCLLIAQYGGISENVPICFVQWMTTTGTGAYYTSPNSVFLLYSATQ